MAHKTMKAFECDSDLSDPKKYGISMMRPSDKQYQPRGYVSVRKLFWIQYLVFRFVGNTCQTRAAENAVEV